MATKKNNKSLWLMLALIVAILVALFFLPSCGGPNPNIDATTIAKVGSTAPDFTVEMVDSTQITLSSLAGKVVLVNFWATWCPPCREELTRVQSDLVDRFAGRNFVLLAISRGEKRQTVEEFRTKMGYTFPMGLDPEQAIYNLYASNYIPRNFLIGPDGKVIAATVGYEPEEFDALIQTIEQTLDKQ